ncbi:MAG: hypothetical protein PUB87_06070 [Eubacteriaceae bacterium]|nr:hypothetical protein [Eubacteriaceae bacterium]
MTATYARPNKVKFNEANGSPAGLGMTTLDWEPVAGVSRYECQVNRKTDGKWTGWKSYVYGTDNRIKKFDAYYTLLVDDNKGKPGRVCNYACRRRGKNAYD